ncbi:diguanylate cyclase domain-containing protein [Paenibacillus sp. An7]|uniref:diguanylate cyclase domain-containing protein n=1 Tax=Paenibacillus sp. An7 TaxID=2689577 RepID=UPI0013586B35|nr:diguanylate cyclase [Paenibacillus sp. An7]
MIKLRTILILTFTSFIILLTTIFGSLLSNRSAVRLQNEIGQSLSSIAYQMSDKLDSFMWSRAGEVEILASMIEMEQTQDVDKTQKLLNQLKTSFPSFSWVGFMDDQGEVLAATDGILVGTNIAERPVFKEGVKGKFIGDVHEAVLLSKLLPNPTGEPLQFVDISIPVQSKSGTTIGVLAAHLSWEWSKEVRRTILEPQKDHIKDLELFIISKADSTVLLGPKNMVGEKLNISSVAKSQKGENDWEVEEWPNGKSYLTGYAYGDGYLNYEGLGWTVLVRQPTDVAFSSMSQMMNSFILIGIIASIIFATIGWFLAETISRPIRGITSAANQLRSGNNVTIPEYKRFAEIHSLSTSLRSLVESLSRSESALGDMKLLAEQDQLTGLPNRIALERYLEETIEHLDIPFETLSFMYIDLDGFKKVNDTLGHQVGDLLLQKVAQRLLTVTKPGNITVRLGGDEFLLILRSPQADSYQESLDLAEEIITLMNKPFIVDFNHVSIGCSIGVAFYPLHDPNIGNIIRIADECLYRSKQSGRNRVTFYEEQEVKEEQKDS